MQHLHDGQANGDLLELGGGGRGGEERREGRGEKGRRGERRRGEGRGGEGRYIRVMLTPMNH